MMKATLLDIEEKDKAKTKEFGVELNLLLNMDLSENEKDEILNRMSVIENSVRDQAIINSTHEDHKPVSICVHDCPIPYISKRVLSMLAT